MGRPRKFPAERLSHYVQARVNDNQWNWLEYKAVEDFDGDLSKALRWCIDQSVIWTELINAPDPRAEFEEFMSSAVSKYELELHMDEEPDDAA
jgi:hypothetical protein